MQVRQRGTRQKMMKKESRNKGKINAKKGVQGRWYLTR